MEEQEIDPEFFPAYFERNLAPLGFFEWTKLNEDNFWRWRHEGPPTENAEGRAKEV